MRRALVLFCAAGCASTVVQGAEPPRPTSFAAGVTVHLEKQVAAVPVISFGLPVPAGTVPDVTQVRVAAGGKPLDANVKLLLRAHDRAGKPTEALSLLIQFPAAQMPGRELDVQVAWRGGGARPSAPLVPYAALSMDAPATAESASIAVAESGGRYRLARGPVERHTLFTGREPKVLATFPRGYLAKTEIFGHQVDAAELNGHEWPGLKFLSSEFLDSIPAALYLQNFPLNPDPESLVDPLKRYDIWLYDRCTTILLGYVQDGDVRFLHQGYRYCSFYQSQIGLTGARRGYFALKPQSDSKYSHNRGLYAYYALTGDEAALEASKATADLLLDDSYVVEPYRQGKLRGKSKLWTERELAVAMENLIYGHRMTDDTRYLDAFKELLNTAYKHITADRATLQQITGWDNLVPQNCLVHAEQQHEGGGGGEPFCSSWMSALMIDPLLRYQGDTNDPRVDEIFVRLARFVRDTGSMYMTGDPSNDTFFNPKECFSAENEASARRLVPTYGGGRRADGTIMRTGEEYSDMDHCPDVSALAAVAVRALRRRPQLDAGKVGPFANELASIMQLHHELAFCAKQVLGGDVRPNRDPNTWTDSEQLKPGFGKPEFIANNHIGFPIHTAALERHFSWWFNTSEMEFALLREVGVTVPALKPGLFKPCP